MPKPKVFISTPCHDRRVHQLYHSSMLMLMAQDFADWKCSTESGGGVALARNQQAQQFLNETDYDYMLSIDSDLKFTPAMVKRLIDHGKPFVAATYAHKAVKTAWSCEGFKGTEDPDSDLWPMLAVGGGFQLVHREVYTDIAAKFPEIRYLDRVTGKWAWDFYSNGVVKDDLYGPDPTYLTEDWYFCYRAIKAGHTVYMDHTFYPIHYGDCAFPIGE